MRAVQNHHISRDPEVTVFLYKGEHKILTEIEWYERGTVSKGFVKALKTWIALNEDRAENVVPAAKVK